MSPGAAALDRLVDEALAEDRFAGAVLRVERRGEVLYERAAGWALRTEAAREPMARDTVFDLASLSKLFTATAALVLVSRGAWSLETPAAELLGLGRRGDDADDALRAALEDVDLRAILTHSSGLHYWHPCYVRAGDPFRAILSDVLAAHPARPGTTVYSDLNFMILGLGVEGATGLALPEAVARLVFGPLGLQTAHYRLRGGAAIGPAAAVPASAVAATEFGNRIERRMVADLGLAFPFWRDEAIPIRGEADDGNCWYYFGGAAGHAGVFCGAEDLCRLGRLYAEGGAVEGRPVIDPGLAAEALRDSGAGRGLGFQLGENYPGGGAGHTGFTGTYLYVHAPTGLVAAALTNRLHVREPGDLNPFRRRFAETALGAFGEERSL